MNKKNLGFTLIEVIAVIVIIGIVFTIAVPAVSSYILDSRKANYFATINSYLETVRGNYEMGDYGDLLYSDEIMVVPIKLVKLDKDYSSTPFGNYDYNHSYVVITSNGIVNNYYANFLDTAGYGVAALKSDSFSKESINKIGNNKIANINTYFRCKDGGYEISDTVFTYNSKEYTPCEYRTLKESDRCNTNETPVIVMCEL